MDIARRFKKVQWMQCPLSVAPFLLQLNVLRLIGFCSILRREYHCTRFSKRARPTASTAEHNMQLFYFFLLFVFSVKHSFIGERAVFPAFFLAK